MGQHVISWREDPAVTVGQHKMLPITCGMYIRALEYAVTNCGTDSSVLDVIRKNFNMYPFESQELALMKAEAGPQSKKEESDGPESTDS